MNTNKLILSGFLALSLAAISAQAVVLGGTEIGGIANVGGASPGDLVLGFRNAANPDIVFDIGQFSSYEGVAPGTYTVGGYTKAELLSVNANAFTAAGTFWTVFGGAGNSNGLTQPDGTLWVASNGSLTRSTTQGGLSANFDTVLSGSLTTSTFGGASDANVMSSSKLFTGLSSANSYSGAISSAVESTAVGSTSLKLWELTPGTGAGTLLGTFNLDDTNGLTFTVAIPEPSVYAAILGAATLGFVAIRRRKQNQLVA